MKTLLILAVMILPSQAGINQEQKALLLTAEQNSHLIAEGFERCKRFLDGWITLADPNSGLMPRNERDRYWDPKDAAADNQAFMVLTAWFTDRDRFEHSMVDLLQKEIRLTSRIDSLPDDYDFETQTFRFDKPDLNRIIFGAAEYVKDGLLPITEWIGHSPWADHMFTIIDDMWKNAKVDTRHGKIISTNVEVNGEMLQVLSRVYWMKNQNKKYLEWGIRLGDYYLFDHHPTDTFESLHLRDHGNEIIGGLTELYATLSFVDPVKAREYQPHIHRMLDRVLEVGRNEHGFFYDVINPKTGEILRTRLADTFGYVLNGFYTVYLLDNVHRYKEAVDTVLENLKHYAGHDFGERMDGRADAVESALNLYNRTPVAEATAWMDDTIKTMWSLQRPSGIIEGWHGDGNFARTTIMYNLWKSQGTWLHPWNSKVRYGAARDKNDLYLYLHADCDWQGTLHFDVDRHRTIMKLPLDWPRINQFPEWFVVKGDTVYTAQDLTADTAIDFTGDQLHAGMPVSMKAGQSLYLKLSRKQ